MNLKRGAFCVVSHRGRYSVRRAAALDVLREELCDADRLILDAAVSRRHPAVAEAVPPQRTLHVTADENLKSLEGVERLLAWLLGGGLDRGGTLYVVGGGTVQDAASFAAAILHRGCQWVFIPTTLLAQGDSCIGSKSSINYAGYKNQLGAFYPPREIIIDAGFLQTLHADEVRSGLGELLHYMLLAGPKDLHDFAARIGDDWQQLTPTQLSSLAFRALEVKRPYVEADEFDSAARRHLNLGHTFGHALEYASQGAMPHGVAVAYGVDMAAAYSAESGLLRQGRRHEVGAVARKLVNGTELKSLLVADVIRGLGRDKKRVNNEVEFILLEDIGRPLRQRVPLDEKLSSFMDRYLSEWRDAPA